MDVYQKVRKGVSHLFATCCREGNPVNAHGEGLSPTVSRWLWGLEKGS